MYLQTTSYDFTAPIDSYTLPTTKSEHLRLLHEFLVANKDTLLEGDRGTTEILKPGAKGDETDSVVQAEVRSQKSEARRGDETDSVVLYPVIRGGQELAFVVNATYEIQQVTARGVAVELPGRSALALSGGQVVYRTWELPAAIEREMAPAGVEMEWAALGEKLPSSEKPDDLLGSHAEVDFTAVTLPHNMLLETRDETDYGWYRAEVESSEERRVTLTTRVSDFLSVWVNGHYVGSTPSRLKEDRKPDDFKVSIEIPLLPGNNELLLLVTAIGMIKGDWMIDAPMSEEMKGILAPVTLDGADIPGTWEFTASLWGERVRLMEPGPASEACWYQVRFAEKPFSWYRAEFTLNTELDDPAPWALNIGQLFKGQLWINGHGLGRYWQQPAPPSDKPADWQGDHVVLSGFGEPPQRYYLIPTDWLQRGTNTLVILEERGARPAGVELVRRR